MKAKQQQLIAVIGLVALGVVVGIAGLLLAVLPQRSKAHSLDAEIAQTQAQLASLRSQTHRGPVIKAAQLFQLARAMPDKTDVAGLIIDLSRAAADANVSLVSVGPQQAVPQPDGSNGFPLRIQISGSWNGIADFLHALRSNVRVNNGGKLSVDGPLFTVDSVELAPNTAAAGAPGTAAGPKGELTASLSVNAFSYGVPLPTTTASTDTTSTTTTTSGSVSAAGSTG
ncbi:MAG TPA: type 4a pilus biogenesis protein PilO [Gaiellaceae bacterium]|nr:type 4a pilus biogenesis protein PilO [Gaiellaceae bacterium]